MRHALSLLLIGIGFIGTVVGLESTTPWVPLGQAYLPHGVTLPMYGVPIDNPMAVGNDDPVLHDFPDCHQDKPVCRLTTVLPPDEQGAFQIVQIPEVGNFLIPRTWHRVHAAVGVDGSSMVTFTAGQARLSYYNASACVGCAYSSAAKYFDNAIRLSKENDFPVEQRPVGLNLVKVNAKTVYFSRPMPNQMEMNGVAVFDPESDLPYMEQSVVLPVSQHALASRLLNFKP